MGGVEFVEFFSSGGDFPFQGFDCFRGSFGHGHIFMDYSFLGVGFSYSVRSS